MTRRRPSGVEQALAGVLLALVTTAACGTGPAPVADAGPSVSPGTDAVRVLAERRTWGGLCAQGPCRSDLVVRTDGSWVLETEVRTSEGVLPAADLSGLEEAVIRTGLAEDVRASTGCAADSDGTSVEYVWLADGQQPRSASSCEQAIAADDPLVEQLDRIAAEVTP